MSLMQQAIRALAPRLLAVSVLAAGQALNASAADAPASAAGHAGHAGHAERAAGTQTKPTPLCNEPDLRCATAAQPTIDAKGQLWLAWAAAGAVSVARSVDGGRSFQQPVVVGRHGAMLDVGADARPQVVVDVQGRVIVSYGVFKDKRYNAQVFVATSVDGGSTFTEPRSISADPASQRFPTLAADSDGSVWIAWLDKRTAAKSKDKGEASPSAVVAYARSADGGLSFSPETLGSTNGCECCRLGMAIGADHRPLVLFRNIYGRNERDHAVLFLGLGKVPDVIRRVAEDRWAIDGCPHHGPSLAVSPDGSVHTAWFTQGQARQGLFYARSTDQGQTFSPPRAIGNDEQQPGRPNLLARDSKVWLAWKEFDGRQLLVKERHSTDAGKSWSEDRVIATATGATDHPVLVADAKSVYLSWMAPSQGYRLIKIDTP